MSTRAAAVMHGAEWMQRIRDGDEAVYETLFRTFAPGLCSFLTRYVGERAIAEELVQDVFLSLWNHRSSVTSPARSRPICLRRRATGH